jgi:hypothetical protein
MVGFQSVISATHPPTQEHADYTFQIILKQVEIGTAMVTTNLTQ